MSCVVLNRIADLFRPVAPPQAWSFLSPVQGMRELPIDSSTLMGMLERDFTLDQLESARVVVRQKDGLGLTPVLVDKAARGLFLRRKKDEAPFDIVNQYGSLATDEPPAFGSCCDFFTSKSSGESKLILVTFSDDDLAVLRMLRLPCTPAAGLAEMTGSQVRGLCGLPHSDPAATTMQVTTAAVTSGNYQLVLMGWRVAELINAKPDGLDAVVSHLHKATDAYDVDLSARVRVWQPTASEFGRIASGVEFADANQVRMIAWQSAGNSSRSFDVYREMKSAGSSSDYGAARRELLRTLGRARELGYQSSEVKKALAAFNRSFGQNVIDAILRDAMASPDSLDRSLLLAAAELMEHLHHSSELVRSTQDGSVGSFPAREGLQPEELKERLRVVNGLVKIHRELTRDK